MTLRDKQGASESKLTSGPGARGKPLAMAPTYNLVCGTAPWVTSFDYNEQRLYVSLRGLSKVGVELVFLWSGRVGDISQGWTCQFSLLPNPQPTIKLTCL